MKRCWIGAAFLLVLLIVSLLTTWAMEEIHEPMEENLEQAAESALLGDWKSASRAFREARDAWEEWAHFRACLADHTPIEEIEAAFASAQVYGLTRSKTSFAASCRELAKKAAAMGEAHGLGWWNIL